MNVMSIKCWFYKILKLLETTTLLHFICWKPIYSIFLASFFFSRDVNLNIVYFSPLNNLLLWNKEYLGPHEMHVPVCCHSKTSSCSKVKPNKHFKFSICILYKRNRFTRRDNILCKANLFQTRKPTILFCYNLPIK